MVPSTAFDGGYAPAFERCSQQNTVGFARREVGERVGRQVVLGLDRSRNPPTPVAGMA